MIDFKNAKYMKLAKTNGSIFTPDVQPFLIDGETIVGEYQGMRGGVVFTNYRLIVINVQGITGKKRDYSSLPYARIQAFSAETAGVIDLDSELELWFSGLGKIKLEFTRGTDIREIAKIISQRVFGETKVASIQNNAYSQPQPSIPQYNQQPVVQQNPRPQYNEPQQQPTYPTGYDHQRQRRSR